MNLPQLLNNQLCQDSSGAFLDKANKGQLKMVNVNQPLKMARSCYIAILIKLQKGLELVSSLQHSAKNMLEMFVIQHTSI